MFADINYSGKNPKQQHQQKNPSEVHIYLFEIIF